ncbi:alpha/beta fold hydrolase [Streptomyces sp. NPDC049040]|uniref:alpha/beta fold hydrolase n=1 Tax=Streptomyces sp. NPDC049040 TaxID=3365593 RepID=UPI00371B502E
MGAASGAPRLGLVLVHGFTSSPDMWKPLIRLIAADEGLGFVEPLPFGYATSLWAFDPRRGIPTFDTVADSLKEFLDTEAEAFDRLMVVSHSQGGLVVQRHLARMTAEGRGADLARIRRVVLLACPNSGSELASGLRRGLLNRNPQERELRPLNELVTRTLRLVLRDIVNAEGVTAHSCRIPFTVYAGETDDIVPPASALGVFPDAAVLPGDHFGIAKPKDDRHRTYTTLRRLILRTWAEPPAEPPAAAPSVRRAAGLPASRPRTPRPAEPRPATTEDTGSTGSGYDVPGGTGGTGSGDDVPGSTDSTHSTHGTGSGYDFPDTLAVVTAALDVSDMDDPGFRALVVGRMRSQLPSQPGFVAAYRAHPRDHLLEIVERCRARGDAPAALAAFRDAVAFLRPEEAATARLVALIKDAG